MMLKKIFYLVFGILFFAASAALAQTNSVTTNLGLNKPSYAYPGGPNGWPFLYNQNAQKLDDMFPGGFLSPSHGGFGYDPFDSSGNLNLSGGLTVTGAVNSSAAVTNLSGTTAGTVSWSQPFQGTSYKKVILNFTGYENTTATAQTISFPTVFTSVPAASQSCPAGIEIGTDEAILPVSMSNSFTGQCILQGQ